jgi:23S rRNA pseudouridine2605 synthase
MTTEGERLAKYLARCGVASRRAAERLYVAAGRVTVDGQVVTDPAVRVRPGDRVAVDGEEVRPAPPITLALYKPVGVLSTARDPQGRPTVLDLLPDPPTRLYPVGRLDRDSEGLLLLSNDGALTARLLHPSHGIPRRYAALVTPWPEPQALERLVTGVRLSDGPARAVAVELLPRRPQDVPEQPEPPGSVWIEVVLREGRHRQVRRMCAAVGLDVLRLVRTAIGGLRLGGLAPGAWRRLGPADLAALWRREAARP